MRGVCTWSRWDVPGPGGCTWSRGMYLVPGGVPGPGGGVPGPGGVPAQILPPCGQTHTCKNITFATSLRTVIIELLVFPFIISVYLSGKTELVLDVQINLKL